MSEIILMENNVVLRWQNEWNNFEGKVFFSFTDEMNEVIWKEKQNMSFSDEINEVMQSFPSELKGMT